MKKYVLFLMASLALAACEEDSELLAVGSEQSASSQAVTRSATSIADFDPLGEFYDIPVNIINVGTPAYKYLSCEKSKSGIDLYDKDDNSGRQQWYIRANSIVVSRGHDGISDQIWGVVTPNNYLSLDGTVPTSVSLQRLYLIQDPLFGMPGFVREYLDNGNVRFIAVGGEPGQISFTYCLAASASDSRHLTFFTKDNMSEITQWQAIPIGEYELVDLQYVRTTVDDFDLEMAICDVDEYNNNTSNEVTWTYSLSIPFTETSNFSTTEGVTVNVSSGLSVGVPNILGSGASISYDTSIQQQSSHSYTFGESTQTTITKTRTVQVPVAPHSKVKMETTLFTYKGTLTYVATLRKIGTNTTFRIKGRWSGNCFSKFVGNVYDVTTTQLLKTYELNE